MGAVNYLLNQAMHTPKMSLLAFARPPSSFKKLPNVEEGCTYMLG